MITNLFSIFDPATPLFLSINWVALFSWTLFLPLSWFKIPNRSKTSLNMLTNYLFNEFNPLLKKSSFSLIFIITLFIFIIFNNILGLISYVFTATRHISITVSLALPIWLAIIIYGWTYNTSNLLIHLIPQSTPILLAPFIVIIETIRNIIRPLTLSIRLAANIVAGHLLITLLTSASPIAPFYVGPILGNAQMALGSLEVAVAFIQAYVFRVLITLYISDAIS